MKICHAYGRIDLAYGGIDDGMRIWFLFLTRRAAYNVVGTLSDICVLDEVLWCWVVVALDLVGIRGWLS